ncbi:hypothetical protein LRS73_19585 [Methylobacterium currus]|nr:hypothetical protein [Methylobacterium currus]UHC14726.1 hypothetical protein LRS73_19585 [Methylobacterium currus]
MMLRTAGEAVPAVVGQFAAEGGVDAAGAAPGCRWPSMSDGRSIWPW